MDKSILIIGAGGLAAQIYNDTIQDDYNSLYFWDNINFDKKFYFGHPVVREFYELKKFLLGIGNPILREKLTNIFVQDSPLLPVSFFSKRARFHNSFSFPENTTILSDSIIEPNVKIGYGSLCNIGSYICHDSILGKYVELCPRVTILGGCIIGDYTKIGAGAVIRDGVKVGEHCYIGMGSVVLKDIPNGEVWVGNPARFLRKNY